jgi:hypothetical protein
VLDEPGALIGKHLVEAGFQGIECARDNFVGADLWSVWYAGIRAKRRCRSGPSGRYLATDGNMIPHYPI